MTPPLSHRSPRPWVWGIDVSTKQLGIGLVNLLTHAVDHHAIALPKLQAGERRRLVAIQDAMIGGFARLQRSHPPATIAVEVPMGTHHKRALDHAEAITLLTLERMMPDTAPWPVNISSWKSWVLGRGNASQAELTHVLADVVDDVDRVDLDQLAGVAISMFAASIWDPGFDRAQLHPQPKE